MTCKNEIKAFLTNEEGVGVIEIVLILVVNPTPYFGMGMECIR